MAIKSVTQFFEAVKQDEALREMLKATINSETCVKIAEECGYCFTTEQLQAGLSELFEEELAETVNPGVAPRRHLHPR